MDDKFGLMVLSLFIYINLYIKIYLYNIIYLFIIIEIFFFEYKNYIHNKEINKNKCIKVPGKVRLKKRS